MTLFLRLAVLGCMSFSIFAEEAVPELSLLEEEWDLADEWHLEEEVLDKKSLQNLPMVLTASRLQQPKSEVPASVTVITAEKIKLWGARTLPEIMKFVPGMFVGHADNENNASVTYHTSSPNIMRRLQVLIDGRSVYKSAIANVIWDDVPIAIEDIDRIEVIRGPNAAMYGANSYLGVINILTKHPEDSLGTALSLRKGNKGVQDMYLRHGLSFDSTSIRISAALKADEGFDGKESTGADALRDGRRHGFVNAYINNQVDDNNEVDVQVGYKSGKTEMRMLDFDQAPPDNETQNGYIYGRWQRQFDQNHQSHLQAYWQKEERRQDKSACASTHALDPELGQLYLTNPLWADAIGNVAGQYVDPESAFEPDQLEDLINSLRAGSLTPSYIADNLGFTLSQNDLDVTQSILNRAPSISEIFNEKTCGDIDAGLDQQRIDIEWQDTIRWSDDLRTVSGISYRQDSAYSKTYFNGAVNNETWRAFLNAEYRIADRLTFNLGGMYEYETHNDSAFSPRIAMNVLLTSTQSIRAVVSQAVRSPDLLETQPEFTYTVNNLTVAGKDRNYLNQTQAVFYQSQLIDEDEENLSQEKITSYEIGYYSSARLFSRQLEIDIKVFYEQMRDLVSDPITLQAKNITNDNELDVNGGEIQLNTQLNLNNSLWFTYSYIDVDTKYTGNLLEGRDLERARKFERRLTSENSVVASWMYNSEHWSSSLSYFYQDSRNFDLPYQRYQFNIIAPFSAWGMDFEGSYYLQHNREVDTPLNYSNQKYSTANVFYAQIAVEF